MLRHHLSIVMLRIFADIAHVWQLAIGTRFVEQYLTKTHPRADPDGGPPTHIAEWCKRRIHCMAMTVWRSNSVMRA